MAPRPRFEVQRVKPGATRRRVLLMLVAVLLAVLAGAAGGVWWGMRVAASPARSVVTVAPAGGSTVARAQAQKIANLKRSAQIARVAAEELRKTLVDREEQISALRADLAFYADLVGRGERSKRLAVHGVRLQPVPGSNAWRVTVTLTRSARRGEESLGVVKLAVQGVRHGEVALLDWDELAVADDADGLHYAFKYFQQLHTTLVLPEGFNPNRLRVLVDPNNGDDITYRMAWSDALKSEEGQHVQQQQQQQQQQQAPERQ